MAVSGKYRRATVTIGSAVNNVLNFKYQAQDKNDRRTGDKDMSCKMPVALLKAGSGSFDVVSGAIPSVMNGTLVATVEDVAQAETETVTNRTLTFANVTTQGSGNFDNNGGEGSRTVNFEYGELTES